MNDKEKAFWVQEPVEELDKEPDLVEVVRCGKCIRYDPESLYCQFWHGVRHPGHFCGEGERKTDD